MNIMLTDLRSLTLDMTEMPVVEQGVEESFTRLLQQQLPQETENLSQVIEFKELLLKASGASSDSEMVSVKAPDSSWRDYLAQQQIQITTDTDPVATIPVELDQILPHLPLSPVVASNLAPAVAGEALPAGGNLLPETSVTDAATLPAKGDLPLTRASLAATTANPGTADLESVQIPVPTALAANATDAGKIGVVSNAIADQEGVDATRLPLAAPVPARLSGVQAMPAGSTETSSIDFPQATRSNETGMRGGLPASPGSASMTPKDTATDGLQKPVIEGIERLDSRAAVTSPSLDADAREVMAERAPLAGAAGPQRQQTARAEIASAREASMIAEQAGAVDPRDALRNLATMTRTNAEVAAPEVAGQRNFELPLQPAANLAPQNVTSMPAPAHNAAALPVSAQPLVQQPLPAQFETLNLARGGDAAEWGNGLGERINWMINQKQNTATIRIDPPMLGKLDVHVKIADDATTITIQTQHAQTRDLIENASQRLRDFLQENGYQNVNVDVSQRQDQQQARSQTASDEQSGQSEEPGQEPGSTLQQHEQSRFLSGEGLLDTFA